VLYFVEEIANPAHDRGADVLTGRPSEEIGDGWWWAKEAAKEVAKEKEAGEGCAPTDTVTETMIMLNAADDQLDIDRGQLEVSADIPYD
jgi:hypothetical protein